MMMQNNNRTNCNCYEDVDRMINEGLGGGFIIHQYDVEKLKKPEPEKLSKRCQC